MNKNKVVHPNITELQGTRPWGTFNVLYEESKIKIKRIVVNPGHRLSLQKHQFREEVWFIYQGTAAVTLNSNEPVILHQKETITIPIQAIHRVANIGTDPLIIFEIQSGDYCEEDDIIRLEDDYSRQ